MTKEISSVAVVGAAGHIGEMLIRSFAPYVRVEAVIRNTRPDFPRGVLISDSLNLTLSRKPDVLVLAMPHPVDAVFKEIAESSTRPRVLVATQNGILVPKAQEVFGKDSEMAFIRACVFTTAGRDREGNLRHGVKRVALAQVQLKDQDEGRLKKVVELFEKGGFSTVVVPDPKSLEETKLFANLVGATGAVTGLGPWETFTDPEIYKLEQRAIRDRMAILKAAGIPLADIPWINQATLIPRVPRIARFVVAGKVAKSRNNRPPAAVVQIERGMRRLEATGQYQKPIIDLGKKVGLRSEVDEAVYDVSKRHERGGSEGFDLASMEPAERRQLLLKVTALESMEVFRNVSPLVNFAAEGLARIITRGFVAKGGKYIPDVIRSLEAGKSVIVAPRHLSHADHPVLVRALKEIMGKDFSKYQLTIVAGMLFNGDPLTRILNRGYPNVTVWTLPEEPSNDEKWMANIINRRSREVSEKRLGEGGIFIVYPEGSRSRDGKLQKAKPGASGYALHPNVELVVPVVIEGTQTILKPGQTLPRFGHAYVEFLEPIRTMDLKKSAAHLPRTQRDAKMSEIVMGKIAAALPEEQRGFYS